MKKAFLERSLGKKMKKEKKKLNKNTKIILYAVLGAVIVLLLFNLGKPVVRDEDSFLEGVLRSLGLMKVGEPRGGGVVHCTGDKDCEGLCQKCGRAGYCIDDGKKKCSKDGKCIKADEKCSCGSTGSVDMLACDSCTEVCEKSTWSSKWYCYPSGKKKCPDGKCIPAGERCCVGSADYIPCGDSCCRKQYSATEKMKCCRKSTAVAGACCKESDVCEQYDDTINFCKISASDCNPATESLCTATETGLAKCCPNTMGCKGKYFPTCTVKTCPDDKKCYDFGSGDILCCTDKEVCVSYDIFKVCVKTGCEDDEFLCPGVGKDPPLGEFAECCKKEKEICAPEPTGRPKCIPSLLGK